MSQLGNTVLLSRQEGIAHICFNRPEAFNAIDLSLAREFHAACRDVAADRQLRALVLSGKGRAFMAGGDLASMADDPAGVCAAVVAEMHAAIALLAQLDAPVIAAVQGLVAGGGLGVALCADLVVAADNARFNVASLLIGASPDCGLSWQLPRRIGQGRALELALLCEPVAADQALAMGLVNRVVPGEQLVEQAEALARRLAAGPALAVARTKRLLRAAMDHDLPTQLQAEADSMAACAASADFAEGLAALRDKRAPRFVGP